MKILLLFLYLAISVIISMIFFDITQESLLELGFNFKVASSFATIASVFGGCITAIMISVYMIFAILLVGKK